MTLNEIKKTINEQNISAIDLKYTDLKGCCYHITFPARHIEEIMKSGIPFDGSSIPGMKAVEAGDMVLIPDLESAIIDPFSEHKQIRILANICDADSRIGVKKDPRSVTKRLTEYMKSTGIADESWWIPEFEFYLFDAAYFYNENYAAGFEFTSSENKRCLPNDFDDADGIASDHRKGYHMDTPFDRFADVRQEMVELIEEIDCPIRYHHHEVGLASQQEIETELIEFKTLTNKFLFIKDIIREVALSNGLTATMMAKPLYNEPGNGMHFHIQLRKEGKNIFYKEGGYADLSEEALYFIGGILKHGRSLTAFTNASTNSYKRLIPGFEAPTKLFFGLANRSAAIRIPKYATTEETKRIEFRTGDASCNPYLATSALIMAGLDGIINKIMPTKENGYGPFDDNVYNWSPQQQKLLQSVPASLEEALAALKEDHEYLLAGDVFNEELIASWIEEKSKEIIQLNTRPHPIEMNMYYNV
ncbi:MAG: type I glutamate--ammonia ligase [Candidatus Cloacimonetes bacterium]|nr:type I glutamate--ammonia ligase [Candidatus Cloacimonadota bacterium]